MERLNNLTKINISALLFVVVMNILTIIDGGEYFLFLTHMLPFIMAIGVLLVFRKHQKKINAVLMFLLGAIFVLLNGKSNFSGAIFIVYAIHLDPGKNKTIFKLAVMTVCIAIKSLLIETNAAQLINLLFLHFLCYGYYYVLFTERKVITITEIEDQTEQIMKYIIDGKRNKEIAVLTFMSEAAIQKRIKRLMIKEGCNTLPQLVFKLYGNGQNTKKIDRLKII